MNRQLSVALNAALLPTNSDFTGSTAVVIDVLRATTVMTTAGANGATSLMTFAEVDQARAAARTFDPPALLCGERHCERIEGFDCGNSPSEYIPERVEGKPVILTTTNGTRAIQAACTADRLLVASFLNLESVVRAIRGEPQVQLICAGTNGDVTLEDILLAGAIADRCNAISNRHLDDSARLAIAAWREVTTAIDDEVDLETALAANLVRSLGGRNLVALGYDQDVRRCARVDIIEGYVERVAGDNRFEYRASTTEGLSNAETT
ncbi:MAG: 2-phosphosulfolactate phosphatase [Planctomycetota bacterium]